MAAPVIGLGRSKNPTFSSSSNGRLKTLHSSKAKVSETVSSRKALESLEPNVPSKMQFQYDLQRVLGKDKSSKSPFLREIENHSDSNGHSSGARTSTPVHPSPNKCSVQEPIRMEASSPAVAIPLEEISQRLVPGLQVDVIFPHSSYLNHVRAELKKVLKQSNPYGYEELVDYFSAADSAMATPFINQLQHAMLPGAGASGVEMVPVCTTAVSNPPLSNTVSDIVALNLEVNTSALNINDQISPEHTPRPRDFLDLVDSVTTDWNATPTRPRMFPHKLY